MSTTLQGNPDLIAPSNSQDSIVDLSFRQSLRTDLMVHQSNTSGGKKSNLISAEQRRLLNTEVMTPDMSEVMFNQVGSCFNQLQMSNTKIQTKNETEEDLIDMKIPSEYLEKVFKFCKRLLDKDLSQALDKLAEAKESPGVYKSFSEALYFIMTSLIRELLQCSSVVLSPGFVKDVQVFIKQLFLSGQNDLQSRDLPDKDHQNKDQSGSSKAMNKFKLVVLTNAVCVDILVWATKDENGKNFLVFIVFKNHSKCRIFSSQTFKMRYF